MWRTAALLLALSSTAVADTIKEARYTGPTDRYGHGILGDAIEWGNLEITAGVSVGEEGGLFSGFRNFTWNITLPQDYVFEDLEPRLWDVTGDGEPEVVTILTQVDRGASLVIFGMVDGKPQQIAATPHIGTRNRWLAPFSAADIDGDGNIEVAYIDRPHLAKVLRVWRYQDGAFAEVANMAGLTNHRIGQDFIQGGVRDCGNGPELIMADGSWSVVTAVRLQNAELTATEIAPFNSPASITAALDCS